MHRQAANGIARAADRRTVMVLVLALAWWSSAAAAQSTQPADSQLPAGASEVVERVFDHTQWLSGYQSRSLGTRDHEQAAVDLLARLNRIAQDQPGMRVWRHQFEVVVPRTLSATMRIANGENVGEHAIFPLWPASVRANTTPREGIEGRLVYVGQGKLEELLPRSLNGQIAVMEMASGGSWQNAGNFGARAIVLLGGDEETTRDAHAHLTRLPLNMPRFYVPAGPLANRLRNELKPQAERLRSGGELPAGQATVARLDCRVEFFSCTAENYYVLVKPTAPTGRPAIMIAAPYDSGGIVPDVAPGADAAVDAATLLTLLERHVITRPARPVMFAFVDAFANNQAGVREMLLALTGTERDQSLYVRADRSMQEEYLSLKKMTDELGRDEAAIRRLGQRGYALMHRYVKDEIARQVVSIETQLHPLRLMIGDRKTSPADRERAVAEERRLDELRQAYLSVQSQLLGEGQFKKTTRELALRVWNSVVDRVEGQWGDVNRRLWVHQERRRLCGEVMSELAVPQSIDWSVEACRDWAKWQGHGTDKGVDGESLDSVESWRRHCLDRMAKANPDDRTIAFMLALDLSDAGLASGPRLFCSFQKLNETGNARDLCNWLKARRDKIWPRRLQPGVDLSPLDTQAPDQFSIGSAANMTSVAPSFGVPAATWATLNCIRARVDTARDRADRLDWRRLAPQIEASTILVDRLTGDPAFAPVSLSSHWSRTSGIVVDQSPGEPVPRVPMAGYIVTLINGYCRGGQQVFHGRQQVEGVRLDEWKLTGTDGMYYFDALAASIGADRGSYKSYCVQAYLLDEFGDIVRAVDLNKVGKGVRLDINISERNASPRRAVVFSCRQVTCMGLFDPRFLLNLGYGSLQDARRDGRPQRMNFSLDGGVMCALLEATPDMRWQALLRAGSTENRMVLINVDDPQTSRGKTPRETMHGFLLGRPLDRSPIEQAALDFLNLDGRRIQDYAEKGLRSEAIEKVHARAAELYEQAEQARQDNDGRKLFAKSTQALSNELLAYQAVRSLANDVVRAAIFLLLALVPFSFAMERLLFASPHVYRQLGGIVGIFAVMTAILWSFHPAFRISSQPLMIIMAFAIIFMSLLVMSIVYQRFKSQLEEMRSGRAESSGARASRGGLAASAIRLGIANMRKRKLRTALTGITVMLITFALLCFTSVSSYIEASERSLSSTSPFTGLFVRQSQQRAMSATALAITESAVGDRGLIVPQYWLCNPSGPEWRLRVSTAAPGGSAATQPDWVRRDFPFYAALGLSAGEERVSVGIDRIVRRWADFAQDRGCYIDTDAADGLLAMPDSFLPMPAELVVNEQDSESEQNRKRDDQRSWRIDRQRKWLDRELDAGRAVKLVVCGREFELLDVYDSRQMDRLVSMTGESIMPIDYSHMGQEQRQLLMQQNQDQLTSEISSGTALEPEQQLPPLSSADLIVLPVSMVKNVPHVSSLRSIAVVTETRQTAEKIAREMAERVSLPIFFGSGDDVRVLAATALTPKGPKSLAIMLVIAGLIIFNTMLNSIAERKKEIHIYSSLGLAPLHIGMLFLAEAATYGLMGSIFGYIVGQGVATLLANFHLLGGVTLNYSGTQAIATMMMVVGVTVLSAMVPAYMAGKLAAPSDVMKWAVPKPDGDTIRDTLPFTVTGRTANGVAMFIYDYLDAHREGSIGHFSTDNLAFSRHQADGAEVLGIDATVWLAPYDLGVRQDVRISISETGQSGVLQIDVELRRGAGQASSWWKLNKTFLGDLRRQLLGWRKLKADRVLEYIASGQSALAGLAS